MNYSVGRDHELPANKANLNKTKLHMDTHMHMYILIDVAFITLRNNSVARNYELPAN